MSRPDTSSQAIVRAAIAEMLNSGASGLKVAAVCRGAGVNQRMLYHHFGARAGLVDTLLAGLCRRVSTALPADDDIQSALNSKLVLANVVDRHVPSVVELASEAIAGRILLAEYLRLAAPPPSRGAFTAWRQLCWPAAAKPVLRRSAVIRPVRT